MLAKLPAAGRAFGLIQASRVIGEDSPSVGESGTLTSSLAPSRLTALLAVSAPSRLVAPSVGAFRYTPGFAPFWSAAEEPLVSPRRQWLTGLSAATVAA